ncbi:trimethylamine--corrinoid protein Co-methyltransferase [Clostridiales Family XIII bacterium PM5-7]
MQVKVQVFSQEERQLVHERTMEILTETGIWIKSEKAFAILKEAGARVNEEKQIVFFTEEMINGALKTAPKQFVLGGRNPKFDYEIPSKESRHLMSGITTNIYDPYTRERRESTKQDVINTGRVFQQTETGVACWSGCSAGDVPEKTHCLHEMAAIMQGTSKHVQFELSSPYESKFALEILEAILGSKEEVQKRKIASVLYCPVSPLTQDKNMLEAYLELADYGVPVNIYPMPMIGLTSPASIFSTICQINAEVLSALVLFQTVKPGWPMIYGVASGAADPITGFYIKSGEAALVSLGGTEMARFYNLPCAVTGGGSFETMPTYLGGADLIDGIGTTDNGMAVSLEMILTEDEIAKRCLRISKGIKITETTDLTEDIKQEGPGGAFLAHKSSVKNFRDFDEIYTSKLFPSALRGTTFEKRDSVEIANKKVRQILEGPIEDAIPDEIVAKIDEICARADNNLPSI